MDVVGRWLDERPDAATPDAGASLLGPGLDSIAAIGLLFDLEDEMGVAFPPERIDVSLFESREHLGAVVSELLEKSEPSNDVEPGGSSS